MEIYLLEVITLLIVAVFFFYGCYAGIVKKKVTVLTGLPDFIFSDRKKMTGRKAYIYGIVFGILGLVLLSLAIKVYLTKNIYIF